MPDTEAAEDEDDELVVEEDEEQLTWRPGCEILASLKQTKELEIIS